MGTDDPGRDSAKQSGSARHRETVRLVFRTPLWHRLIGVGGFLLGSVAAFAAAIDFPGVVRVLGAAIGVSLGFVAWRFWRLRIEADSDGILVVDWRKQTRIQWRAIQRFSWDPYLEVLMRDGTSLLPDLYGPRVMPITGQLNYMIMATGRRLQDELRRQRHAK